MLHPDEEWRAYLKEGRFMIQRSRSSGSYVFYPRIAEPGSGSRDLEWVEASGHGTVHAVTVVRKKNPNDSYNVVLIDLAEGVRLMSRIEDIGNDDIHIGLAVKARVDQKDDQPLLVFVPV
jgi:uncharacterized protein